MILQPQALNPVVVVVFIVSSDAVCEAIDHTAAS